MPRRFAYRYAQPNAREPSITNRWRTENFENAKKWYDWALTPEAQSIAGNTKVSFQVPSNKNATVPPQSPKLGEIKLINYDFVKYGSSAERAPALLGAESLDERLVSETLDLVIKYEADAEKVRPKLREIVAGAAT